MRNLNKEYMRKILTYRILCAAALALVVVSMLVSCLPSDDGEMNDSQTECPEPLVAYEGKWDIGAEQGVQDMVWMSAYGFVFDTIPATSVVRQLFPGSEIGTVETADNEYASLKCSATPTSAGSVLYSAEPAVWRVAALIDGRRRVVSIAFSPRAGSDDDMSWGTLSKAGVLTLVLHATSYTVDGGEAVPTAMKLVFTATRKK